MLFMFPLLFLSPAFIPVAEDIEWLARLNPITYGVDAIRALVIDEDVLTVLEITGFGGIYDTLVPAVAVLVGLNLLFGASRSASSGGPAAPTPPDTVYCRKLPS